MNHLVRQMFFEEEVLEGGKRNWRLKKGCGILLRLLPANLMLSYQVFEESGWVAALAFLLVGHLMVVTLVMILAMFALTFGWWIVKGALPEIKGDDVGEDDAGDFVYYCFALGAIGLYLLAFDWPSGIGKMFWKLF